MTAYRFQTLVRLLAWIAAMMIPFSDATAQAVQPGVIAVTGAALIDGSGAAPLPNATVIVTDGRISAVGSAGSVRVPEGARVIDAEGRWLVPGFVDAHAHVSLGPIAFNLVDGVPQVSLLEDPEVPARSMRTLMAHGVTAIRDPGGDPAKMVALRSAVGSGALVGPRMQVAGRVIDGTPFEGLVNQVHSEDEIRAAVRADAEAGVDPIKLYVTLNPQMLGAAIDEAHDRGGHRMATRRSSPSTPATQHVIHPLSHRYY